MNLEHKPHIAVVGDLMIDEYIFGNCKRISPEAPVQIVNVEKSENRLGGAGNVVSNLLSLGAQVSLCSVVGDDDGAEVLEKLLSVDNKVKYTLFKEPNRVTTKKSRIVAANQQIIRYDLETKKQIQSSYEDKIIEYINSIIRDIDAIILSDYDKGVLSARVCQEIINIANKHNRYVLVDPKGNSFAKYKNATLITPNKQEASIALDMSVTDKTLEALLFFRQNINIKYPLITMSEDGIALLVDEKLVKIPTIAREVYDVTGAGDTVISALCFGLCNGMDIQQACQFANAAAAVVVAKVGSATATIDEILEFENNQHINLSFQNKILDLKTLLNILPRDKKIVFTNGCFDILHPGHASYLAKAKELGDILVVGLNSDDSVKRLKGKNRPINNQQDRAYMLAALSSTDYIVTFEQDTPYELIKAIKPDILVKGADYKGKEVVGRDIAKEVILIDFIDGRSTTNIINRIKKSDD
jgi:D-beta-D-heptose 7-phosphate kinase/D-beta-D-heptose 1-phosphate adenosyltransferase